MQKITMDFTLEKLINDIKSEKDLWNPTKAVSQQDEEALWSKIASRNKLSSSEAKSIFRVLAQKYKQEHGKPNSKWKLFNHLSFLDEAEASKQQAQELNNVQVIPQPIEEETYVELLEVKDEDFSDEETLPKEPIIEDIKPDIEDLDKEIQKHEIAKQINPPKKDKLVENMKRKAPEPNHKDFTAPPEKRVSLHTKEKIIHNGTIKHNAETETEAESPPSASQKYRNFGFYVESTLNRLSPRLAAKLEIKILQSIIEVNSEMMQKLE